MVVTVELNKQLHALLAEVKMIDAKPYLVESFTNGRSSSSKDMTNFEAIELIKHLKAIKSKQKFTAIQEPTHIANAMPTIAKKTDAERANTMRKKMIAIAHQMGWSAIHPTSGNKIADMKHINEWCEKYGYLHKQLNAYTIEELPKLVTQFENLYKSFLKAI